MRKILFGLILIFLFAVLSSNNFAFAKKLELNGKQVEKIKTGLDLVKTFGSIVVSEDKLKTVLNTVFAGGETSLDITYGLLVLGAFNEMELIDLVVSQRYKKEADKYFNSILDERLNLLSYYKGVGFDLPRVLSGKITGPIAALTLNTFSISNEAVNIFTAIDVLRKAKTYDALWTYFDYRRNGESHKVAWEDASFVGGWVLQSLKKKSVFDRDDTNDDSNKQLELQFAQLWDKWGQYTNAFGITQETKQRFNEEMRGLVAQAIEAESLAGKNVNLSTFGSIQSVIVSLMESVKSISMEAVGKAADLAHKAQEIAKGIINYTSQLIGKGGAGLINPQSGEFQQLDAIETQSLALAKDETHPVENLVELSFPQQLNPVQQEIIKQEILELRGILNSVKDELEHEEAMRQESVVMSSDRSSLQQGKESQFQTEVIESKTMPELIVENLAKPSFPQEQGILNSVKDTKLSSTKFCEVDALKPMALGSVIFQEVAWMGSINSANDEWMKLKNISNGEVNLEGWQVQDADNQIQIALGKDHNVSSQGSFILERTNNDSLPGVQAHAIYAGALNNINEALYLFDEKCVLRDKIVAVPDWPAGDSGTRKPMERMSDLGWQTLGSVQSQNSSTQTAMQTIYSKGVAGSPPPTPVITYSKILISEVQTAGVSSQIEEFVELYNPTSGQVNLTDWYIQKKTQGGDSFSTFASKNLLSGKTIQATGYLLIAREGSSFASSADAITTYSLADNNTLALKNPDGTVVDKIGWGDVQDAENTPASNPQAGQSLNRIWDTASQTYYDRDNNSIDFVLHNPASPRAVNPAPTPPPPPPEEPPPSQDTTPPQVMLNSIASSQNDISFSLSWSVSDPQGDATPSGVQSIFVEYTVTPSATGVFAQYDNNGAWTDWQTGSVGKLTLTSQTTVLSLRAQDGISYAFQVKAKDVAGNESVANTASTAVSLAKTVVINEVAWAGTKAESTDEWLELFNSTTSLVDLTGWKITSSDSAGPELTLTGTIAAGGFYLIERTDNLATTATAQLTASFGNGLSNTACEILYLYNAQNTVVDATVCKSDGAWSAGTASPDYISMERIVATTAGSNASNWANNNLVKYNNKDAGSNWINGTPGTTNSTATSPTTIEANIGLRFNEFSTMTLMLLGSPYITTGITIPESKTLIVEPGVRVKYQDNRGYLTVQGTLKAQGTQANGITFTVTDFGAIWCGIKVTSTSTASQLDYVTIDKAQSLTGGGGCNQSPITYSMYVESSAVVINNSVIQTGAGYRKLYLKNSNSTINAVTVSGATSNTESVGIYIDGGSPTISNSTISNNSIGILVNALSNSPTIQNNAFTGNTKAVKLESAGALLSGNTATNNTYNGIFFEGAVLSNTTWQADAIPYIANRFTINAGATLTIQAGVVTKFANTPYTDSGITVQGTLITQGTALNPVVFTAVSDNTVGGSNTFSGVGGATSWKWIYLAQGSTGSQLTHTAIKYGGNTYNEAALYVKQSDVQVSNLTISNSNGVQSSAIYSSNGTIAGSDVTLINNIYGFNISGACPALANVTRTGGTALLHPSSRQCSF